MRNKSVMQHRFANVPSVEVPRSTFDRSAGYKCTFDAGYLVPVFIDIAVPGDTMKLNMAGFTRLSTPTYPIMDNMFLSTFFFAVPIRLIWDNFVKMMGEQVDPGDSIDYSVPEVTITNAQNESLWDYFGLPTKLSSGYDIGNLFGRSYNLIWNTWFRDQNLQDSVVVDKDDGPDTMGDYVLLRRGKRHDYFTSALPWLQKGDAVQLALGDTAPIIPDATGYPTWDYSNQTNKILSSVASSNDVQTETAPSGTATIEWNTPGLEADLANATASTVNELRQAIQVQRLLERDARSGTRYIEIIHSHFGVTSDDSRLQRPEYLGGGITPVNITAVARTDSSPGALGALGTSAFRGHGFVKSFTEHCVVMGIACVNADLTYQEGIDKMHLYSSRYDFYWPVLANLGEQAIQNQEIYLDDTTLGNSTYTNTFGYQERYAEMRYRKSLVCGKFRSNDAASLDAWHLGIEFGSLPTLDATFIQENPPVDRVIVTPTEPHFLFDSYINLMHTRPMPVYSVPGLIDHF